MLLFEKPYKLEYWYSVRDVLGDNPKAWDNFLMTIPALLQELGESSSFSHYGIEDNDLAVNGVINDVWNITLARNIDNFIIKAEDKDLFKNGYLEEPEKSLMLKWLNKFIARICLSAPYYLELLKYYKTTKGLLLDKLKSTNTSLMRYNDTPQNGGDYQDDQHTSNITSSTSESSTDTAPLIEKIKEIQNNYKNLLEKWTDELGNLFFDERNL